MREQSNPLTFGVRYVNTVINKFLLHIHAYPHCIINTKGVVPANVNHRLCLETAVFDPILAQLMSKPKLSDAAENQRG